MKKWSIRSLHIDLIPGVSEWRKDYHTTWCPDGNERETAHVFQASLSWLRLTAIISEFYMPKKGAAMTSL